MNQWGKIDVRKRRGQHKDFLKIYNQTYDLHAKTKFNRLVTSFANNGLLIVIFLVLCSQTLGVGASKSLDIEHHVTQEIYYLGEKYNVSLTNGKPTGFAYSWNQRIFSWDFGKTFIPATVSDAGILPSFSFCNQNITLPDTKSLMNEVSSCQRLGKRLEKQNIVDYKGTSYNPVSFIEEHYLDRIIMSKVNKYITHRKMDIPGKKRVDEVNRTLHLSHYVLRQKLQHFYFSKNPSVEVCRISICSMNDIFTRTIFMWM